VIRRVALGKDRLAAAIQVQPGHLGEPATVVGPEFREHVRANERLVEFGRHN
jgi:hypothetical protein